MSNSQNFRSAFNGFNRDDVVNYISFLTTKHENQINQLQSELEMMRREMGDAPRAEESDSAELEALRSQVAQLQQELKERDEVIEKLKASTPSAVSHVTERELDAYRRAESAERRAMERVSGMYAKTNGVLADTVAKVEENADFIGKLAAQVQTDLDVLRDAVAKSQILLEESAAAVAAIRPEG